MMVPNDFNRIALFRQIVPMMKIEFTGTPGIDERTVARCGARSDFLIVISGNQNYLAKFVQSPNERKEFVPAGSVVH